MSLPRLAALGGPEGNDRRGQDRGHAREGQGWRADRGDREGGRRLGADGQEVREDGGPVARAPEEEGAGERAARAAQGDDRLLARRRPRELAQAAPHGREGVREAPRRARLRGVLPRRAALREAQARGDGPRARPQGRRGLPDPELAARRGAGRLRRGGPRGAWRPHQGEVPGRRLPALQRGARPSLLGRDVRVRLPGAPQRVRVRGRRAEEGGLRQRHRGRQARRGRGRDVGALPALRGALRARLHLHQPPARATRGATPGTRSGATGGTSSCPSRPSTTSPRSTRGCSRTAST